MATARKSKKLNKAWLHDHLTDPVREAGAARGLPGARRLQAEGDRRAAAPAASRASSSSTSARRPGAWSQYVRRKFGRGAGAGARRGRPAARHHRRPRPARVRADRGRRLHPGRLPRGRGPGARSRPASAAGRSTWCSRTWRPTCRASPRPTRRGWPTWSNWRSSSPGATCGPKAPWSARSFTAAATASSSKLFKATFRVVKPIKPKASRAKSAETFLVGIGLKPRASGVRYSRVAEAYAHGGKTPRGRGLDWTKIGRRCRGSALRLGRASRSSLEMEPR